MSRPPNATDTQPPPRAGDRRSPEQPPHGREPHRERRGGRDRRDGEGNGRRLRAEFDALKSSRPPIVRRPDVPGPLAPVARRLGLFQLRGTILAGSLDGAAVLCLFALTQPVAATMTGAPPVGLDHWIPWTAAAGAILSNLFNGGYQLRTGLPGAELSRFGRLLVNAALMGWAVTVLAGTAGESLPLGQLLLVSVLSPAAFLLIRTLVEWTPGRPRRVIIVGSGYVAERAAELMRISDAHDVVGHVDDDPPSRASGIEHLGAVSELPKLLERERADVVLVAFPTTRDEALIDVLRQCDQHAVDVEIVPRLFEFTGLEPNVTALGDLPIVQVRAQQSQFLSRTAKRAFDGVMAAGALLVLLPVMAIVALLVALDSGRPVLYRQRRVGRGGELFDILKFRSMTVGADKQDAGKIAEVAQGAVDIGEAVAGIKSEGGDPRVTRLGGFLRKTSLDELPQLWNVLRGDMSVVGPRPLRPFEVEQLHAWQLVRQDVRPGITGLWQVLGRSRIGWHERMQLDYAYVRHWSPVKDIQILARTVPVVARGDGAK